jgi:uncharacterized membrane protein YeaQ/YmgE (transglycosylase-associated protein family)
MENWIGVGIWIILGAVIGLVVRILVSQPEEAEGHVLILVILGAFGAVVGGMLGVGIAHFHDPVALSLGGMTGAVVLSVLMAATYRWAIARLT